MARVTLVDPSSNGPRLEDLSTLFPRASALLGAARSRTPARPDGELARVAPDTDSDLLLDTIDRDGGLVIEGLLSPASRRPHRRVSSSRRSTARGPGFRPGFDDSFYGSNTVRVQGIAAKSRTFVDEYLLHPTLLDIADRVLLPYCGDYWMSQSETIYIGPGQRAAGAAPRRPQLEPRRAAARPAADLGARRARRLRRRGRRDARDPAQSPVAARPTVRRVDVDAGRARARATRSCTSAASCTVAARTSPPTGGARRCTSRTSSAGSRPRRRCRSAWAPTSRRRCRRVRVSSSASPGCPSAPPTTRPRPRSRCGSSTPTTPGRRRHVPQPLARRLRASVRARSSDDTPGWRCLRLDFVSEVRPLARTRDTKSIGTTSGTITSVPRTTP